MHVLILGGTNFFGYRTVWRLAEAGHQITLFTRGHKRPAMPEDVEWLIGERTQRRRFEATFGQRRFDAVIDNIAYEADDVESALRAFAGRIGHYVLTSSAAVYETLKPFPCPAYEDQVDHSHAGFDTRRALQHAYAVGKIACERVLFQGDPPFPFTTIRPPVVSGSADPTLRGYYFIQRLLDGGEILLPRGEHHFRQVYSEDLAGAYLAVLGNARCLGKAYNVASREIVSLRQHVEAMAAALGVEARIVEITPSIFEVRGFLSDFPSYHGPRPPFPCIVPDIGRAEAELDFHATPYREWIEVTARWFAQEYRGPASAGYSRRQEEIRLAREYREQEERLLSQF